MINVKGGPMKRIIGIFIITMFILVPMAGANDADPVPAYVKAPTGDYVPGELLIKYKPEVRSATAAYYQTQYEVTTVKSFNAIGVDHVKLPQTMTVEGALEVFQSDPNVEYAEPNYYRYATGTPDDTYFGLLWGMHNTGQTVNGTAGTPDADIDAPEAWDITTGSSSVVVAVVDTGVSQHNPDLSGNLWTNPGEIPGNGLDDDGNGYVDDVRGWDFVFDDNEPNDANGHGTHVAGTVAAVGNNSTGVTGVSWSTKIMALRFLDSSGYGYTSDAISAILYANANGAHVINNSWGGSGYSQSLKDAIDASSAVVVCAAGNGGSDLIGDDNDAVPFYPSSYTSSNLIAVAATDQNDNRASFSNYGPTSVDVAAPGVNILSTLSTVESGDYGYKSGTSMAAPHVAGLAALIHTVSSSASSGNRTLAATDIIQTIKDTVDPLSSLSGVIATGGRINAYTAVYSGGNGDGGGCFIATAAFGSIMDPHVKILRHFRDRYLKTSRLGRTFVNFYYKQSPSIAKAIQSNESLRQAVRTALLPVVGLSWVTLKLGLLPSMVLFLALAVFGCAFVAKKRTGAKR
tara:strand:+ start:38196 stop:39914 length:1719 start_codon:yes stop_codon:yes gene_type:complete